MTVEAISVAELKARYGTKRKPSKFKNRICRLDGFSFDSEAEMLHYRDYLKVLMYTRDIERLRIHPRYPLVVNGVKVGVYEADFEHFDCAAGVTVCTEIKGFSTPLYRIKAKLMAALYPEIKMDFIQVK